MLYSIEYMAVFFVVHSPSWRPNFLFRNFQFVLYYKNNISNAFSSHKHKIVFINCACSIIMLPDRSM